MNSNVDSVDRLNDFINEIIKSYNKIRSFESEKCTQEQLEQELRHIRDIAGNYPTILSIFVKESSTNLSIMRDLQSSLKPEFTDSINKQLLVLSLQQNLDEKLIKAHVALALASINYDSYIDNLKGYRELFRI